MNHGRVHKHLESHQLDAVIATSAENVVYTSGLANRLLFAFQPGNPFFVRPVSVVTCTGATALVAPAGFLEYLAGELPLSDRVYLYGRRASFGEETLRGRPGAEGNVVTLLESASLHETLEDALRCAVADYGLRGGRLGVDEEGLTAGWRQKIERSLRPFTFTDAADIFRSIRLHKTEDEISTLRTAVRGVEKAMAAAFVRAYVGVSEGDLERWICTAVANEGLMSGHCETSAGARSGGRFPPSCSYTLKDGDVIRSDCGGRLRGYWADTGRSAAVNRVPVPFDRYYSALEAGIEGLVEAIRPGAHVGSLARSAVERVRSQGIPDYRRAFVGHGIGLELYEAPLLVPEDEVRQGSAGLDRSVVLEDGMVVNIELPYFQLGLGGLQIEETVVVRPDGCELLTSASRKLFVCGLQ